MDTLKNTALDTAKRGLFDIGNAAAELAALRAERDALRDALTNALPYLEAFYKTLPDDGTAQSYMMIFIIEPARAAIAQAEEVTK